MADNQIKINKYSRDPEALDLREEERSQTTDDVKRVELPPLPDQMDRVSAHNDLEQAQIDENDQGVERASLGGIVATSQAKHLQEVRYKEIENVLANGLDDLYLDMDRGAQQNFKKVGEETGRAINALITNGKCSVKKIVEIIKKWLSLIPGVNKFFLEQEAKIKADKIMNVQRKYV